MIRHMSVCGTGSSVTEVACSGGLETQWRLRHRFQRTREIHRQPWEHDHGLPRHAGVFVPDLQGCRHHR